MEKNKKSLKTGLALIVFLVALGLMNMVYKTYNGVYNLSYLTIFISTSFVFYLYDTYKNKEWSKKKIRKYGLVFLGAILVTFLTLPKYTYEEGKELVTQEIYQEDQLTDYKGRGLSLGFVKPRTNPFMKDMVYIYEGKDGDNIYKIILDPVDGSIFNTKQIDR